MSINSEDLFEKSRSIIPGGVHSPVRSFRGVEGFPVFMESAFGPEIFSVDGNSYIDFCLSWGPLILGHRDPDVEKAVIGAVQKGWSFGTAEPYSLELATLITQELPWIQKIRFVNSGTEAVMSALRVARAATGKSKIIKFDGCYHGHVDSMLVRAGSGLADMASPDSAGVSSATASETIVAPLNDLESLEKIMALHQNETAALIIEPLPANNGLLIQTKEFLVGVAALCKKYKILLVFDEVISGFRTGFQGMAGKYKIEPDLCTYGKIIGGGFPVGAFGGKKEWMDLVAPVGPVYQAGTLSGNPVAMVTGFTTLLKLKEENPYESLAQKTSYWIEKIKTLSLPFPVHFQNEESLFWGVYGNPPSGDSVVRSLSQVPENHKKNYIHFFHHALKSGVYFAPSAFEVGFLSTAHTELTLNTAFERLKKAAESL